MKSIIKEIIEQLNSVKYENGDLSDIGNEIGIILGKYLEEDKLGYELSSFIHGIEHGISITKGTH
jgi:hypothetical protein